VRCLDRRTEKRVIFSTKRLIRNGQRTRRNWLWATGHLRDSSLLKNSTSSWRVSLVRISNDFLSFFLFFFLSFFFFFFLCAGLKHSLPFTFVSAEQNIRSRITQLQEFRRIGMTTLAAVEHYEGDRRKKEAELLKKNKESAYSYYHGQTRRREEVSDPPPPPPLPNADQVSKIIPFFDVGYRAQPRN